jgi:hypothetical protein
MSSEHGDWLASSGTPESGGSVEERRDDKLAVEFRARDALYAALRAPR